jgi:uncharacterized protein (TIGR02147 family)
VNAEIVDMADESIYRFSNYKRYLEAHFKSRPKAGRGLLKKLGESLSMTSAQVSHVMRGDRELTPEQALGAAKFLGHNEVETQYFVELVSLARTQSHDLKEFIIKRLELLKAEGLEIKNQVPDHRELSDSEKAQFYSSWVYSATRLLSSLRPLQIEDLVQEFNISRDRAAKISNFLVATDLCVKSSDGIRMGSRSTFVPRSSPFISKHHTNWRTKALEKAEQDLETDLFFTSPVSMSEADFQKFKVKLTELIKDFSSTVKDSPAEAVACLNFDYFRVR